MAGTDIVSSRDYFCSVLFYVHVLGGKLADGLAAIEFWI